jgi:predicted RecB family nuclease
MAVIDDIFRRCVSGTYKGDLTAQNVSLYHTSPYAIYCEEFVSEDKKDPRSPYRELLHERGTEHEKKVIETGYPEGEAVEYKEPEEGFSKLLEAMDRGAEVICGLPLLYLSENMQGIIDILQKRRDHSSVFGDYYYLVKEIKLAKHIKEEHVIQGAFYTYLIGKIQDYLPERFFIINRDYEEHEYRYADYEESLAKAIEGTRAILEGREVPTPTYNGCEWPWERYCNHEALRTRDVSLVGQVGPKTKANLVAHGFEKIWDISSAKAEDLQRVPRIGAATAQKLVLSARAIKEGELIPLDSSVVKFPEKSTEIFLDLEGTDQPGHEDELVQVDYLIGTLIREDGREEYTPYIAHRPEDEEAMFREFMEFMRSQRDYVIYHWHNYEYWHIKKLGQRHGLEEEVEGLLLPHMIDLHKMATRACVFPTYGNGLKDVAGYLGFTWRREDINALDAIAYYLKYQDNPDGYREKMQAIVDYNEDDCTATRVVKDWLGEGSLSNKGDRE